MKRYILACLLFVFLSPFVLAQPEGDFEGRREKIKALKVAYITEKLQLTSDEAQRFWPVYNEFDEKRHNLEMEISGQRMDKKPDIALMTDEEVDRFIQERLQREEQVLGLKKEYYVKFKEVLPIKKVFRLFEAETGFKKLLLERLQEGQRPPLEP
jgi:hypothetical protein